MSQIPTRQFGRQEYLDYVNTNALHENAGKENFLHNEFVSKEPIRSPHSSWINIAEHMPDNTVAPIMDQLEQSIPLSTKDTYEHSYKPLFTSMRFNIAERFSDRESIFTQRYGISPDEARIMDALATSLYVAQNQLFRYKLLQIGGLLSSSEVVYEGVKKNWIARPDEFKKPLTVSVQSDFPNELDDLIADFEAESKGRVSHIVVGRDAAKKIKENTKWREAMNIRYFHGMDGEIFKRYQNYANTRILAILGGTIPVIESTDFYEDQQGNRHTYIAKNKILLISASTLRMQEVIQPMIGRNGYFMENNYGQEVTFIEKTFYQIFQQLTIVMESSNSVMEITVS